MVKNENTARSKHIETRYHYSRELLKRGLIELRYCATTEQVADAMTKPAKSRQGLARLLLKVGFRIPEKYRQEKV